MKFMMNLSFPADLQAIDGIKAFFMWAYTKETDKIVQVSINLPETFTPPTLTLITSLADDTCPAATFALSKGRERPQVHTLRGLSTLAIYADIRKNRLTSQFFDFRRMSSTTEIHTLITFEVAYLEKWDVPRKYKRRLPGLFAEDLASWDRQDHIPDEEEEKAEEAKRGRPVNDTMLDGWKKLERWNKSMASTIIRRLSLGTELLSSRRDKRNA
ncbi:hypothetical protein EVG20_g11558 [Dentipellis fragilis]|uniref:Uncharacterized protein n=1 Tax=Dentipellis fragilis TaxID=205917 RepID=A0A4Y9XMF6_9AGAM|nr:hypothetical protein EVG20_g11558 [Dentipellis fragilis]